MWKLLHSMLTELLQFEWNILQWTLCGWDCTVDGQCFCMLNGVCYSELYVGVTSQLEESDIAYWIETLHWRLFGRHCTAGGQWYFRLNGLCYSEQYVYVTSQQVDIIIAAWMGCVTVNSMYMLLHSKYGVLLQLEWNVLQWKVCGCYFTASREWYCSLNGVCYSEQYVDVSSQ